MENGKIWMDGELVPWDEAKVHVLTHTLHYGVGVFEGIRCYAGEDGRSGVFRLPEHIERLFDSAHILGLTIPFSQDDIIQACLETVRANALKECYIRPLVFVGEGDRGLHARTNPIRVSIAAWAWGAYLGEEGLLKGIRVKTSSFQRFHVNTLMTKAKAVGTYLNSILAGQEVWALGYDEALLLDTDGYVAEGPGENIFVVRRGRIKTPAAVVFAPARHYPRYRHQPAARYGCPAGRGPDHPGRGLSCRRGIFYRHGRRGHADSRARRPGNPWGNARSDHKRTQGPLRYRH